MKKKISIIVPCYNEEEVLSQFYKELKKELKELKKLNYEIIFVDDGSEDNTINEIKKIRKIDKNIKYIVLSRNFGKESAMYAGLEKSVGDYVAIMDADLQDPPSLLGEMYNAIKNEGYDSVATRRISRKGEPKIRSFFARLFYKIIAKISKVNIVSGARDFRLMSRQMVNSIVSMCEYNRFSKGIFCWVGFKTKWLEYENIKRIKGNTKWSFWKLFIYSIEGIVSFSSFPLVLSSIFGILFILFSFLVIIFIIVKTLIFGDPTTGWPSLVCIIFFISGIQLFCIGIMGQYISRIFLEVKRRPIYIVKETNIIKK